MSTDWTRDRNFELDETVRHWTPKPSGRSIWIMQYGFGFRLHLYHGREYYASLEEALERAEEWMTQQSRR